MSALTTPNTFTTTFRGKLARRRWEPVIALGDWSCWRCHRPIRGDFHLDDRTDAVALPECAKCRRG